MSKYVDLMWKARSCMECSIRAESEWAKKFWRETALKLEFQAKDLKLEDAASGLKKN